MMRCKDYLENHDNDMEKELHKQIQEDTRSAAAKFAAITPSECIDLPTTIYQSGTSFKRILRFDEYKDSSCFKKQEHLVNAIESVLDKSNCDESVYLSESSPNHSYNISNNVTQVSSLKSQENVKLSKNSIKYDNSDPRDAENNSNGLEFDSNYKTGVANNHDSDEMYEVDSNLEGYRSQSVHAHSDNISNDCLNCRELSNEIDQLKKQMVSNFQILKLKVMSTDELISEHHKKCADLENEEKNVKDLKSKLEGCYGEAGALRIQLQKALQANEPLKRTIRRFEYDKSMMQQSLNDLELKLEKANMEIGNLKGVVNVSHSLQDKLKRSLDDKKVECENERKKVNHQAKTIDKLNRSLKTSKVKLREQNKALKKSQRENEMVKSEVGRVRLERTSGKASKKSPIGILSPSPSPPPGITCNKKSVKNEINYRKISEEGMLMDESLSKMENAIDDEMEELGPNYLMQLNKSKPLFIPTLLSPPLSPIPPSPTPYIHKENTAQNICSLFGDLSESDEDGIESDKLFYTENALNEETENSCENTIADKVEINSAVLRDSYVNKNENNSTCSILNKAYSNSDCSLEMQDKKNACDEIVIQKEHKPLQNSITQCNFRCVNSVSNHVISNLPDERPDGVIEGGIKQDSCADKSLIENADNFQKILSTSELEISISGKNEAERCDNSSDASSTDTLISQANQISQTCLVDIETSYKDSNIIQVSEKVIKRNSEQADMNNISRLKFHSAVSSHEDCESTNKNNRLVKYPWEYDGEINLPSSSSKNSNYMHSSLQNNRSRKRKCMSNPVSGNDSHLSDKVIVCGMNDSVSMATPQTHESNEVCSFQLPTVRMENVSMNLGKAEKVSLVSNTSKKLSPVDVIPTSAYSEEAHCSYLCPESKRCENPIVSDAKTDFKLCNVTNSDSISTSIISVLTSVCKCATSTNSCYSASTKQSLKFINTGTQLKEINETVDIPVSIDEQKNDTEEIYNLQSDTNNVDIVKKVTNFGEIAITPATNYHSLVNTVSDMDHEVASLELPVQRSSSSNVVETSKTFSGKNVSSRSVRRAVTDGRPLLEELKEDRSDSLVPVERNVPIHAISNLDESTSENVESLYQVGMNAKCEMNGTNLRQKIIKKNFFSRKVNLENDSSSCANSVSVNADDLDGEVASFELASKYSTISNAMDSSTNVHGSSTSEIDNYNIVESSCSSGNNDIPLSQSSSNVPITYQPISVYVSQYSPASVSSVIQSNLNVSAQNTVQSYSVYSAAITTNLNNSVSIFDAKNRPSSPTLFPPLSPPLSPIPPSPRCSLLTPIISPLPTTPLPESVSPLPPSPKITSPPLIRGSALLLTEDPSLFVPKPHKTSSAIMALKFGRNDTTKNYQSSRKREDALLSRRLLVGLNCPDLIPLRTCKSDEISRLAASNLDKVSASSNICTSKYNHVVGSSMISSFSDFKTSGNSSCLSSCSLRTSITEVSCYPYKLDTTKSNGSTYDKEKQSQFTSMKSYDSTLMGCATSPLEKNTYIGSNVRSAEEPSSSFERYAEQNEISDTSSVQLLNNLYVKANEGNELKCRLGRSSANMEPKIDIFSVKTCLGAYSSSTITKPIKEVAHSAGFNNVHPPLSPPHINANIHISKDPVEKSLRLTDQREVKEKCHNLSNNTEKYNLSMVQDDIVDREQSDINSTLPNHGGSIVSIGTISNDKNNDTKLSDCCPHVTMNRETVRGVSHKNAKIDIQGDESNQKLHKVNLSTSCENYDNIEISTKKCSNETQCILREEDSNDLVDRLSGPLKFDSAEAFKESNCDENITMPVSVPDLEEGELQNDNHKLEKKMRKKIKYTGVDELSFSLNQQNIPNVLGQSNVEQPFNPLSKHRTLKLHDFNSELLYCTKVFKDIRNKSISKKDAIFLLSKETNLSNMKSLSKAVAASLLDCNQTLMQQILKNLDDDLYQSELLSNVDKCSCNVNSICSKCANHECTCLDKKDKKCLQCKKWYPVQHSITSNVKDRQKSELFYRNHTVALNSAVPLLTSFERALLDVLISLLNESAFINSTSILLDELQSKMVSEDGFLTCQRLSLCRIFAAICRLHNMMDRLLGFIYSLCYDQLPHISYSMFFITCYSVWPSFITRTDLILQNAENADFILSNIELSPLPAVLQFIALLESVERKESTSNKILEKILSIELSHEVSSLTYCKLFINELVVLLSNIKLSFIIRSDNGIELCPFAFSCIKAIEILCKRIGWEWTYNELICDRIWNLIKSYVSGSDGINVDSVAIFFRLSGYLCQFGILAGFKEIQDYSRLLIDVLDKITMSNTALDSIETAIVHTLLIIAPVHPYICQLTLKSWLDGADKRNLNVPSILSTNILNFMNQCGKQSKDFNI